MARLYKIHISNILHCLTHAVRPYNALLFLQQLITGKSLLIKNQIKPLPAIESETSVTGYERHTSRYGMSDNYMVRRVFMVHCSIDA